MADRDRLVTEIRATVVALLEDLRSGRT